MSKPIITFHKATKQFGNLAAVDNVSFKVSEGEVIGFVGPNGAGKTTTINMLMGFVGVSSGTVKVFGNEITPQHAWRLHHDIGFATGDMELPKNLTAEQYLRLVMASYHKTNTHRKEELVLRFKPQLRQKIHTLSRGNKQKIALLAAFMVQPKLIILDEPSSGLDPLMQEVFIDLIREEKLRGTTIFMSSHILSEVAHVSDRILFMKRGKIIRDQLTTQLFQAAQKHVTITAKKFPLKLPIGALQQGQTIAGTLAFFYTGTPGTLLGWLNQVTDIGDIIIKDNDIDDIFFDLYRDEDDERKLV